MKNKQNNTIIVLVLSCSFIFIFRLIPILSGFLYAFKDYSILNGLFGSPWVGFQNFRNLFSTFAFHRILSNTIRLNIFAILTTIPIAGILVYLLNRIKSNKVALMFTVIFSLPAIMPSVIKASSIAFLLGINIMNYYDLVFAVSEALRWAGYCAIGAYFLTRSSDNNTTKKRGALKSTIIVTSLAILAFVSRIMSSNPEFTNILINPIIYEHADVIDTYSFRSSFMLLEMGISSTLWVIKFLIELISTTIATVSIVLILKFANRQSTQKHQKTSKSDLIPTIINSVISFIIICITIFTIIPKESVKISLVELNIPMNLTFFIAAIIISIVSSALASLMAFPFSSRKVSFKLVYLLFLIPALYGAFELQKYLFYRSLGLVNTVLPLILCGFLPIWMITANAIMAHQHAMNEIPSSTKYIKRMAPLIIVLAAINFSIMWGGYIPSMIFLTNSRLQTFSILIKNLASQGQQSLTLNLLVFIPLAIVWILSFIGVYKIQKANRII